MLQFLRQKTFSYVFSKPPLQQRGFLFFLTVGFAKELDPLSGMTIGLPLVDEWLGEFVQNLSPLHGPSEILFEARRFFSAKALSEKAVFSFLNLREERAGSWTYDFRTSEESESFQYESSYFFENFRKNEPALWHLHFVWQTNTSESADLLAAGLRLLKDSDLESLAPMDYTEERLRALIGKREGSNSFLKQIRMESKDPAYVLILE